MSFWNYTVLSILPPVIVGTVFFRKLKVSHRYLFYFLLTGFIAEIITLYLRYFTEIKNNMPVGHTYISISFIFIAIFYLYELKGHIRARIIIWCIILFEAFSILNLLFFQSYYDYPSTTGAISALILVTFSVLLFSNIMVTGKIKHLSQSSLIWINTAVLIYYSGNFFFYILFNLILDYTLSFIHTVVNFFKIIYVIFYTLLAVGFWKAGTKMQQ